MTPIQQSIDYLRSNIAGLWVEMHESGLSKSEYNSLLIKKNTLVKTVAYLESLLPEEERVIRETYNTGETMGKHLSTKSEFMFDYEDMEYIDVSDYITNLKK